MAGIPAPGECKSGAGAWSGATETRSRISPGLAAQRRGITRYQSSLFQLGTLIPPAGEGPPQPSRLPVSGDGRPSIPFLPWDSVVASGGDALPDIHPPPCSRPGSTSRRRKARGRVAVARCRRGPCRGRCRYGMYEGCFVFSPRGGLPAVTRRREHKVAAGEPAQLVLAPRTASRAPVARQRRRSPSPVGRAPCPDRGSATRRWRPGRRR